jgi:FAD/FMN-containing dehydrogenase
LWSREQDVTLRVRGGRCSIEGWSNINNGVVLDISRLKDIEIDTKHRKVHVGAGVLQGELTNALSDTGYYTALGDEYILGLIGVLLGGGIGLLSRHKGPGCDSLLEVSIVLADGSLVKASRKRNRDLFFACRGGGGGNFGVVTSFVMKLYVAPQVVVSFTATWPTSQFFEVYDTWQHWAPVVKDNRLSSKIESHQDVINLKGVFLGTEAELGDMLAPIQAVAGGTWTVMEVPFSQFFHGAPSVEQPFQKYSPMWMFKPIPQQGLVAINQHLQTAPTLQSNFFSLAWGGATHHVPKGGTAFPKSHRHAIFYSEPGAEWSDSSSTAYALSWVESLRLQLEKFFHGGYVNVVDRSISQYGEEYYGRKNYAKLQRIKQRYDEDNVFHFEQSVPLS